MRSLLFALSLLPFLAQSANIILSNDDGWAELNIRVFYKALTEAGDLVVLSAPAENESGTGEHTPPQTPSPTHSKDLEYTPFHR